MESYVRLLVGTTHDFPGIAMGGVFDLGEGVIKYVIGELSRSALFFVELPFAVPVQSTKDICFAQLSRLHLGRTSRGEKEHPYARKHVTYVWSRHQQVDMVQGVFLSRGPLQVEGGRGMYGRIKGIQDARRTNSQGLSRNNKREREGGEKETIKWMDSPSLKQVDAHTESPLTLHRVDIEIKIVRRVARTI